MYCHHGLTSLPCYHGLDGNVCSSWQDYMTIIIKLILPYPIVFGSSEDWEIVEKYKNKGVSFVLSTLTIIFFLL